MTKAVSIKNVEDDDWDVITEYANSLGVKMSSVVHGVAELIRKSEIKLGLFEEAKEKVRLENLLGESE